jgi:NADPH-dependent glutamate synthase beta subunit-like oxidoreductase
VEGEDCPGVIGCATFLRDVNLGREVKIGRKVVVVGGGNAAIDAARTSLRLGAAEVVMLYRRTRVEMPANAEEIDGAIEEGVDIQFLAAPKGIKKTGDVIKIECFRMKLGEPDASGRRRPQPLEGSEFILECDNVIAAIGQKPQVPQGFDLETRRNGTLVVDDALSTGREGVFAGGDVVSGPASVIEAIAAGRQAAEAIDRYLGGKGSIDEVLVDVEEDNPYLGHDMEFAALSRAKVPSIPMERRCNSFAEIELGLSEAAAIAEAGRCLKCPLRLRLSSPWLPPAPVR